MTERRSTTTDQNVENESEGTGGSSRTGLSRRRLFARAAGAAVVAAVAGPQAVASAQQTTPPTTSAGSGSASASAAQSPSGAAAAGSGAADGSAVAGAARARHAVGDPRGSDIVVKFGRSKEGRFGTMFKTLAPFAPDDALLTTAAERMVEARGPADDILPDGFDNPDMPSGFIYFGQFIDHDMTHDTTPLSDQQSDPSATTNFVSPVFDLGCLYGQGPKKNPELYDPARPGYLLTQINANGLEDLPRASNGQAFVGDGRNDENLIVSQLQLAFIKLHNRFMDNEAKKDFAKAQQLTQFHYQWVIVNDFLPRVVGRQTVNDIVAPTGKRWKAKTPFYKPGNPNKPMMPIEYSVAAYRWGHSGIRPEYEMHDSPVSPNPAVLPIFSTDTGPNPRDLRGSRPLFADAAVDWAYFFDIPGVPVPDDRNQARLIDTQVARPLRDLPESVIARSPGAVIALAQRNLLRGKRLGLSAGQDVAAAMRSVIPTMPVPLTNAQLGLPEAGWGGKAPLWYYILKEAELGGGRRLGTVGGRIVAEVILGLLDVDKNSYFNATGGFTPIGGPGFAMGDLIKLAGAPYVVPSS